MSERTTNIYLTALSDLRVNTKRTDLFCMYKNKIEKNEEIIPGIFSGEAALRYYIRKNRKQGICPDRYMF